MTLTLGYDVNIYAPGAKHPPHQHDELQISVVLSGLVSETVSGSTEYGRALSVVVKDSGVVHADQFGDAGAKLARVSLPCGVMSDLAEDPSRTSEWRWTHDSSVAKLFLALVRRARDESTRSFDANDPDLLDLVAAITARRVDTPRGNPPQWLVQTVQELRESWHPEMRVAQIARRAGVHPVYLARCMRRWYGIGVAEEVRRLRMRSATIALAETDATVSSVAYRFGFADEPHLCREFRRVLGMSPGRFRSLVEKSA